MKEYVAGFAIDPVTNMVALVRKNRPEKQKGKWNAIGGKVEPGESPEHAMVREFREETGKEVANWEHRVTLRGPDFVIYFYVAQDDLLGIRTTTDEVIDTWSVKHLALEATMKNLFWILPLALDRDIVAPTVVYHV